MAMETILGNSLKDVEERKAVLPDDFDMESFFDEAEQMLTIMHKKNLHHRDLHSGNIMFENKDGKIKPVFIDFGHSAYSYGHEDPYRVEDFPRPGIVKIFPKDDAGLKKIKINLSSI